MTLTRTPLTERLAGFGTTIFAEMSALAVKTDSINLGQGFPDTDGPREVLDAAIEAIRTGVNQYPPGPGTPGLRHAIADHQRRFYGLEVDPDREVLVTAGATEALAGTLLGMLDAGDEVVVFEPMYDSYQACIALADAVACPVVLRPGVGPEGQYGFDRDELRAAFSSRTKLILLNTPHNPTGKVFTRDELTYIAELAQEFGTIVVTDEVYEHLVFSGAQHIPMASLPGMAERTLTISSGGKTFNTTGWKIGWACGPAPLVDAARTAKQFLTYVSGAPFQPAIEVGLGLPDQFFVDLAAHQAPAAQHAAQPDRQGLRRGGAGRDRRARHRARPDRRRRRGLRAPRLPRRHPRPDRHPARHGRAHADDLVRRQDVQHHGLEDRVDVRAGADRHCRQDGQAVPHLRQRGPVPAGHRRRPAAR
ncbi:MAG TPA: aminotransferase class I/II-fold pyridoxal phosphate-dependent enzyme [Ilumatobacteraceae bacterium]|nr:aminotransferase class I/II-fold pyridoxal phosphate-dependent enzyme [Ilumatobacteraceae bacterium]